jgi:hypothetical protein
MDGMLKQLGDKIESTSFKSRVGMLEGAILMLFDDESLMLKFAGTIRIEEGRIRLAYHYEPKCAIVMSVNLSSFDLSRLLSSAGEFPGCTHTCAHMETIKSGKDF